MSESIKCKKQQRKKTSEFTIFQQFHSFIRLFVHQQLTPPCHSFHLPLLWHQHVSVGDKVGREDAHATVLQSSLPPVVLGVSLGGDGDAVTRDNTQIPGLLPRERVHCCDDQLPCGSTHRRPVTLERGKLRFVILNSEPQATWVYLP